MVTGLYAAILALIQIKMSFDIIRIRRAHRISIGDGGREDLARLCRVHGNFIETVPIALILMALAEFSGAHLLAVHGLGIALVLGRLLHRAGLITEHAPLRYRFIGMLLTFLVMIVGAGYCLFLSILTQLYISLL